MENVLNVSWLATRATFVGTPEVASPADQTVAMRFAWEVAPARRRC